MAILTSIARVYFKIKNHYTDVRISKELLKLTDRQLRDIGLTRWEVESNTLNQLVNVIKNERM